jgi:hypothetical protein
MGFIVLRRFIHLRTYELVKSLRSKVAALNRALKSLSARLPWRIIKYIGCLNLVGSPLEARFVLLCWSVTAAVLNILLP